MVELFYNAKGGKFHSPKKQPFSSSLFLCNLRGCFFPSVWSHRDPHSYNIRKKGFGPRETQAALGNFVSPREDLAPWVSPGISRCLCKCLIPPVSPGVFGRSLRASLGVFESVKILQASPGVFVNI